MLMDLAVAVKRSSLFLIRDCMSTNLHVESRCCSPQSINHKRLPTATFSCLGYSLVSCLQTSSGLCKHSSEGRDLVQISLGHHTRPFSALYLSWKQGKNVHFSWRDSLLWWRFACIPLVLRRVPSLTCKVWFRALPRQIHIPHALFGIIHNLEM